MKKLLFTLLAVAVGAFVVANGLAAGTATKRVTIVHVTKGCHVWSVGAKRTANLSLTLHRGATLAVVNQDLDMHRLVQVSGPKTKTGPFLMMNQRALLRFAKAGLYRFHTRVADMRGMPKAKTIGPDNKLVLTVRAS
jgi:hypothetical protein